MLNCMAIAVREGTRASFPAMIGASLGNLVLMLLSALGLSWIVGKFPTVFTWIQWGGAGYLVWLGIQALRNARATIQGAAATPSRNHFRDALIIAISNPKGLLYFGALMPQFVQYDQPLAVQFAKLSAIFLAIDLVWMWLYAYAGQRIMAFISSDNHQLWFNRFTALLLIAVGLVVGLSGSVITN